MVSAKIVINSHLNDAKVEDRFNRNMARTRRDFVDFLKRRYPGCELDRNVKIDPETEWDLFCSDWEKLLTGKGKNC